MGAGKEPVQSEAHCLETVGMPFRQTAMIGKCTPLRIHTVGKDQAADWWKRLRLLACL